MVLMLRDNYFVLSGYARLTDGRTDRRMSTARVRGNDVRCALKTYRIMMQRRRKYCPLLRTLFFCILCHDVAIKFRWITVACVCFHSHVTNYVLSHWARISQFSHGCSLGLYITTYAVVL